MTLDSESKNTVLRLWLLLHRVRDMLFLCEDSLFAKYGLTTEQLGLLGAVKTLGGSPRPTDLAQRLERSPNSISMLVDRMVKAGLVRRTRDRKDRRTVFVSATSKGEKAVGLALPAGWELIQKLLSSLSDKDKQALVNMLEIVKGEAVGYLHPQMDVAEINKESVTNKPDLYKRMVKNVFPSGSEAKRQGGKKTKTT
jgi:DNA-binding MarR family transcriptional regulator